MSHHNNPVTIVVARPAADEREALFGELADPRGVFDTLLLGAILFGHNHNFVDNKAARLPSSPSSGCQLDSGIWRSAKLVR